MPKYTNKKDDKKNQEAQKSTQEFIIKHSKDPSVTALSDPNTVDAMRDVFCQELDKILPSARIFLECPIPPFVPDPAHPNLIDISEHKEQKEQTLDHYTTSQIIQFAFPRAINGEDNREQQIIKTVNQLGNKIHEPPGNMTQNQFDLLVGASNLINLFNAHSNNLDKIQQLYNTGDNEDVTSIFFEDQPLYDITASGLLEELTKQLQKIQSVSNPPANLPTKADLTRKKVLQTDAKHFTPKRKQESQNASTTPPLTKKSRLEQTKKQADPSKLSKLKGFFKRKP
jgi:hypothetical protein